MIERSPFVTHVLKGTAATLSLQLFTGDEFADPGLTTVSIQNDAGTAIVTDAATAGNGTEPRTYTLAAANTANLDVYTVTWETTNLGTVQTHVEIVGNLLFTIDELRQHDDEKLRDETRWRDALIEGVRAHVTEEIERYCNIAFIPRYRRLTLDGNGTDTLFLPLRELTALRSAATRSGATWTAVDLDNLIHTRSGLVIHEGGTWPQGFANVRIEVEHGTAFVPEPIRQCALELASSVLADGGLPARAVSLTDTAGTIRLSYAGRREDQPFGIPHVDATLTRYRKKRVGLR